MVLAGNKTKRLSSVNHTTKTSHHYHHHVNNLQCLQIKLFRNISVALEKFLVHNIP